MSRIVREILRRNTLNGFKKLRFLGLFQLSPLVVIFSTGAAFAQVDQGTSVLEAMGPEPVVICGELPILERGKFQDCRFQYLRFDLPEFLATREEARVSRVKRAQSQIWDWLDRPPSTNCDTLPDLERGKFTFHCNAPDLGSDILGTLQAQLASLKAERETLAGQIVDLRAKFQDLSRLQDNASPAADPQELEAMTQTLQALDAAMVRIDLMGRLSAALGATPDAPTITSLAFAEAPQGVALRVSADENADTLGEVTRPNETVIIIKTADPDHLMVVHPSLGVGYATVSDFRTK